MKYKVLEKCHVGGRMCHKDTIVEFNKKIDNKYLKPVDNKSKVAAKKQGETLGGLHHKPVVTGGMAAKSKTIIDVPDIEDK